MKRFCLLINCQNFTCWYYESQTTFMIQEWAVRVFYATSPLHYLILDVGSGLRGPLKVEAVPTGSTPGRYNHVGPLASLYSCCWGGGLRAPAMHFGALYLIEWYSFKLPCYHLSCNLWKSFIYCKYSGSCLKDRIFQRSKVAKRKKLIKIFNSTTIFRIVKNSRKKFMFT